MQPAVRIAPYRRISDDREGREAGVTRQWEDMSARINDEPTWTAVLDHGDPWTDNDLSAMSGVYRPGFEEIMSMVEGGMIDAVLAWTANRFLRSRRDRMRVIDLFKQTGTRLIAINGPTYDYTTADGRMMADLIGAIDAGEAERTAERVTRAAQQRAEEGRFHGGARPYGYGPIVPGVVNSAGKPARDWYAIVPEEAEIVRSVADRVIKGESLSSIAVDLNRRGIPPTRAKAWERSTLRNMLLNPRIAGLRSYKGSDHLTVAQWAAIISPEEWRAIAAILRDGHRRTSTGNQVKRLLAGHCYCGGCGVRMVSRGDIPGRTGIYYCPPLSQNGRPCPNRVTMTIPAIDRVVIDVVSRALQEQQELSADTGAETNTAAEITAAETRIEQYARDAASGKIDGDILYSLMSATKTRIDELRERQAQEDRRSVVLSGPDAAQRWESGDLTARRSVLAALVDGIIVRPTTASRRAYPWERVRVVWRKHDHDRLW